MEKRKMLQNGAFCVFFLLAYSNCAYRTNLPVTLYLIRHAERPSGVDSLNEEGMKRAADLAEVLKYADIQAIYTSDTRRAQQTAQPLVRMLQVPVRKYEASDKNAVLKQIKEHKQGDKILIVGHSNTLPFILCGLNVTRDTSWLPHDQYDDLFQVLIYKNGTNQLNHLKYGAVSKLK